MSDESVGETKSEPGKKRRGNPLMVRGGTSLNPAGRPKRGESLAEMVRHRCRWPEMIDRLESIVLDPKSKDSDAIAAYNALADRGHGKPLSSHELRVSQAGDDEPARTFDHLSVEEMRAIVARLDGEPSALPAPEQG